MTSMADEDLRIRVRRLLTGGRRADDLDRLFLGLRDRARRCPAVLEIGDFIAHRDQREKGLVTQVGRDVFTSFDVWSLTVRRLDVGPNDFIRAAEANLRLASDDQIREGLGSSRQMAAARLNRAIAKVREGRKVAGSEWAAFNFFGNRFMWRPAFSGDQLHRELTDLLVQQGLLAAADVEQFAAARAFIILHAITTMHGSSIRLENGSHARLFAGFANRDGWLEVKVDLVFHDLGKPLMAPICLFLSDLRAEAHCTAALLADPAPVLVDHWSMPIEIDSSGRLAILGC